MSSATRARREKATVRAMVAMYCADHHRGEELCPDCAGLVAYAESRVDRCAFKLSKPTCARCPVHCYEPERRERMRTVMRYSGPRMMLRHPYLTIMHVRDGLRRPS